jgi:hypothetical protein
MIIKDDSTLFDVFIPCQVIICHMIIAFVTYLMNISDKYMNMCYVSVVHTSNFVKKPTIFVDHSFQYYLYIDCTKCCC